MAQVRVGVRRISSAREVAFGEVGVDVWQLWVEINGHRFTSDEINLLGVRHVQYESCEGRAPGPAKVVIELGCEGFATADHREPVAFLGDGSPVRDALDLAEVPWLSVATDTEILEEVTKRGLLPT